VTCFNGNLGLKAILKPEIGNEILHIMTLEWHSVRSAIKSTMFCTETFTNTLQLAARKIHCQTDHILIDRRWLLYILHVPSLRGADSDTDRYLVAGKVRERLSVSKQAAKKFDVEKYHL
jgi:hypothetical protein